MDTKFDPIPVKIEVGGEKFEAKPCETFAIVTLLVLQLGAWNLFAEKEEYL